MKYFHSPHRWKAAGSSLSLALCLLLWLPAAACGEDPSGGSDAGADAAPVADSGPDSDSGPEADSGPSDASLQDAGCVLGEPADPTPTHDATFLDPDLVNELAWSSAAGATGYDVYFGAQCPPPAYPDPSFTSVADPALPVTLDFDTSYCWQVVATDDLGCDTEGPVWSLQTGSPCLLAPVCPASTQPPQNALHAADLDVPATQPPPLPPPPSLCHEPRLKLKIRQITVHEEFDDFTDDIIYCVITAESAVGDEVTITSPTQSLTEGDSYEGFTLQNGMIWGQNPAAGPTADAVAPGGDLTITYDCFEQEEPQNYVSLVNAIASAATTAGATQGTSGWLFPTPGTAAPVVAAGLALIVWDEHLFHTQHIIPANRQLELTNGYYYSVRQSGTQGTPPWVRDWDWELFIQAWGCVDNGM